MGCHIQSEMYRTDRRNILERTHARRPPPIARRKNGRTRILPADRIHRPTWHCLRKDEDRHTGTNRRTQHPLRFDGYTRRRMRLPQVLIHEYQYAPFEATAMLDLLYQRRSAPDSARRAAGFSPVQRTDSKYRSALLPQHRNQDCHLPRQRATSGWRL